MDCGVNTIITKRRYPSKITICAKITRRVFDNLSIKKLLRPTFTYYYNININGVNRGNQIKAFYPVQ